MHDTHSSPEGLDDKPHTQAGLAPSAAVTNTPNLLRVADTKNPGQDSDDMKAFNAVVEKFLIAWGITGNQPEGRVPRGSLIWRTASIQAANTIQNSPHPSCLCLIRMGERKHPSTFLLLKRAICGRHARK